MKHMVKLDDVFRTFQSTRTAAWSKWRLGGPMAGLNGLIRLHLKAWGCPPHS